MPDAAYKHNRHSNSKQHLTMSDIILKFWPKEEVTESKLDKLKSQLTNLKFVGDETDFWGKPAYKTGEQFNTYFEPLLSLPNSYIESLTIAIQETDYGVIEGEEDFEYIDRFNVVSIWGGDGTFENWNKLTDLLKDITGDEYHGGYELL